MRLRIEIHSNISKSYELQVRAICKEAVAYCESIFNAGHYIETSIKEIKKASTGKADVFYKVDRTQETVTVWHLNAKGDTDRKVATITKDKYE